MQESPCCQILDFDVWLQIVERTNQAELHASALGLVLRSVEADPAVSLNFFREGIALTLVVLQHPKCILSLSMLKTCLAQCGDLSEYKLWRGEILVDLVLPLWSRWDNECRKELSMFLTRCVRIRNRFHVANVHQLVKVNAIDRLLYVLKDECTSDQRNKFTSTVSSELLSFLDAALAIAQYPHSLLSSLVDFVVLLHDAKLTYVVHSKTTRTTWMPDLEESEVIIFFSHEKSVCERRPEYQDPFHVLTKPTVPRRTTSMATLDQRLRRRGDTIPDTRTLSWISSADYTG